jgi:uncharacterized protein (DUF58 family)
LFSALKINTDRQIFLSSLVVAQREVATNPGFWSLGAMTALPFWLISFADGRYWSPSELLKLHNHFSASTTQL